MRWGGDSEDMSMVSGVVVNDEVCLCRLEQCQFI